MEVSVLLTGGYDKRACAFDSRAPGTVAEWKLFADVECIKWDPFRSHVFYISTEDGLVQCFDVRSPTQKSVFTLQAHDSAVSSLDLNPSIPGCMVTGSGDKQVKLWALEDDKPKCLIARDLDAGKIFSTTFSCDDPYTLAVGGSKGKVVIWNLEDNAAFKRAFPPRQFGKSENESENERAPRKELLELVVDQEADTDPEEEEEDEIMEGDYSDEAEEENV